jgi:hypothetical protein
MFCLNSLRIPWELDLHRLKIPHPALRRNKRIIRPKQKPILQARGGFPE